jgi:hypothetical protein
MSLIGIQYKQPRVFAHDAISLAVNGAGIISDPVIAGTGYTTGIKDTTGGSGGATCKVRVLAIGSNGEVLAIEVANSGNGYAAAETLTISSGSGTATFTITKVVAPTGPLADQEPNLPGIINNTGVCLYVGTGGDISVTMESGNDVIFTGVANGSFLPVLVTAVTNFGATQGVLALY